MLSHMCGWSQRPLLVESGLLQDKVSYTGATSKTLPRLPVTMQESAYQTLLAAGDRRMPEPSGRTKLARRSHEATKGVLAAS